MQGQYVKPFTERESEVLLYLCKGLSNKELSEFFNLSMGSIKRYVTIFLKRTGAKSRHDLIYKVKTKDLPENVLRSVLPFIDPDYHTRELCSELDNLIIKEAEIQKRKSEILKELAS